MATNRVDEDEDLLKAIEISLLDAQKNRVANLDEIDLLKAIEDSLKDATISPVNKENKELEKAIKMSLEEEEAKLIEISKNIEQPTTTAKNADVELTIAIENSLNENKNNAIKTDDDDLKLAIWNSLDQVNIKKSFPIGDFNTNIQNNTRDVQETILEPPVNNDFANAISDCKNRLKNIKNYFNIDGRDQDYEFNLILKCVSVSEDSIDHLLDLIEIRYKSYFPPVPSAPPEPDSDDDATVNSINEPNPELHWLQGLYQFTGSILIHIKPFIINHFNEALGVFEAYEVIDCAILHNIFNSSVETWNTVNPDMQTITKLIRIGKLLNKLKLLKKDKIDFFEILQICETVGLVNPM